MNRIYLLAKHETHSHNFLHLNTWLLCLSLGCFLSQFLLFFLFVHTCLFISAIQLHKIDVQWNKKEVVNEYPWTLNISIYNN